MNPAAPLTPKEYAAEEFGGRRSPAWVRAQCALFIRTKGREGIAVVAASRPYLIPATERGRFSRPLVFNRSLRCA
jgi:hypothetical protein